MKKNMGNLDRIIRIIFAVLLASLFFFNVINGIWAIISLIVAGILLATSAINFCPLYTIFGLSTTKKS